MFKFKNFYIPVWGSHLVLLLLYLLSIQAAYSQISETDSLKQALRAYRTQTKERSKEIDTTWVRLLLNIAESYDYTHKDSLGYFARQAYEVSKKKPGSIWEFQSRELLSRYQLRKGEYERAIRSYRQILESFEDEKFSRYRVRVYKNLANSYLYDGSYKDALENYLKGIELAEKHQDYAMLSILNDNTAQLFEDQKNYEQAMVYFRRANHYDELLGDFRSTNITLCNQALIFAKTGKYLSAMRAVDQSIDYFEKIHDTEWLAYACTVKAKIYSMQNRPGWAIHWFEKSRQMYKQLDDPLSQIEMYAGLGKVYFQVREIDSALNCARRTMQLSRDQENEDGVRESTALLYQIYKEKGEVEQSLNYLEQLHELTSKNYEEISRNNLALMETKASFENKRQLAEVGNQKTESWRRILSGVILVAFLLLGTTIYFLVRHQSKLKRLFVELRARTKDLHKREKELESLNQTKDRMFSVIGHDLRGPVGALQEVLNMVADEDISTQELLMHLPKLKTDVDHVSFTLNNLLSWGQSQMNGIITRPKSITVKARIDHSVKLLSQLASQKDIKIYTEVPENAKVWSDGHHLDIILRNLLSNAIKFTSHHGLIHLEVCDGDKDWIFKVRDTGIGMDQQTVQRIFTSSDRFTTYGTQEEKGTGLGLSLCQDLTQKNKGRIWVESEPGKGSSFFFTLPKKESRSPLREEEPVDEGTNSTDPDSIPKEYAPR